MNGKIYKYTNIQNGMAYIGQTIHSKKCREGLNMKRYSKSPRFWNAIQHYGIDSFKYEILEDDIPIEKLNEREIYWISYYHTYINDPECNGYNLTPGGDTPTKVVPSEERKKKVSNTLKGHVVSEETRKKISESKKGKRKGIVPKNFNGILKLAHDACSKKILDKETGIVYNSKADAANAYNHTVPWLNKRIGEKFIEVS